MSARCSPWWSRPRAADALGTRLADSLREVLLLLGVAPGEVEAEHSRMSEVGFRPTRNRRVLGTLNDFIFQLSWYLNERPAASLLEASLRLAETPCGPIGHASPDRLRYISSARPDRAVQ